MLGDSISTDGVNMCMGQGSTPSVPMLSPHIPTHHHTFSRPPSHLYHAASQCVRNCIPALALSLPTQPLHRRMSSCLLSGCLHVQPFPSATEGWCRPPSVTRWRECRSGCRALAEGCRAQAESCNSQFCNTSFLLNEDPSIQRPMLRGCVMLCLEYST